MIRKFFKSIISECITEYYDNNKIINLCSSPLSKDEVNVIYVPIGRMPKGKAEEYIKGLMIRLKERYPEYKLFVMAV